MNISTVSSRSGVPAKTIRYYESVGLIPAARRAGNGYRQYTEMDIQTLSFVQRARSLGFSVDDVASLLDLWHNKKRTSAEVQTLARQHLDRTQNKIRELQTICQVLEDLIERCHGDSRPDCPILDEFSKGPDLKRTQ